LKRYASPVSVVVADPAMLVRCDLTLLMGLSGPDVSAMAASDQSIRLALARTGTAYEVLYGSTRERLAQTLQAVEKKLGKQPGTPAAPRLQIKPWQKPWIWLCGKCGAPQCEHGLLMQLLAKRSTAT
jgi:hypothetical protein